MRVDEFDFHLPSDRIAQSPVSPRDSARLLHVQRSGGLEDRGVSDLPELLLPGDLMVTNDTRVLPARLSGKRLSSLGPGATVEVTLHKFDPTPEANGGGLRWRAFAKPARKLKPGDTIRFADDFEAHVATRGAEGEVTLVFQGGPADFTAALHRHGVMPLPPYIKRGREGRTEDASDYQTMFAAKDGAVAAPTASLHFTPGLMEALAIRGVQRATLTLHVGAGTFLPVKADDTRDHVMHAEWGQVDAVTAERINTTRARGGRVLACGSTVLRLLEAAADPAGLVHPFEGETDIFITPGYRFKAVDLMLTNFHLPRSTLFMLVAAFAGLEPMRAAYAHAIAQNYRFYSYGDACLLECASPFPRP